MEIKNKSKGIFNTILLLILVLIGCDAYKNVYDLDYDDPDDRRAELLELSVNNFDEVLKHSDKYMNDNDALVRAQFITEIGSNYTRNTEKIFPLLVNALNDDSPVVRYDAELFLGKTNNSNAIDPLVQQLNKEEEALNLVVILNALSSLNAKDKIKEISEFLRNDNPTISLAAIKAISTMIKIDFKNTAECMEWVKNNIKE